MKLTSFVRSFLMISLFSTLSLGQAVPGETPALPKGVDPNVNPISSPVDWSKIEIYRFIGGGRVPMAKYKPLTMKERKVLWLADTLASDGAYLRPFLMSAPDQIHSYPSEWTGFTGYMQRVGTSFAYYGIQNTTQSGLQALLKHEPRYVACACKGVPKRALHAILYSVITLNDDGHKVLNISPYIGAYAGQLVTQSFYPEPYDVWRAMRRGNGQLYWGWIFNEFREFAPDMARSILWRPKKP
jgi:hypothetical protein